MWLINNLQGQAISKVNPGGAHQFKLALKKVSSAGEKHYSPIFFKENVIIKSQEHIHMQFSADLN